MPRNPKQDANLKPIKKGDLTSEEAKRRGSNGGKKSGETRRAQRDLKATARYFASLAAKGTLEDNLQKLGVPKDDRTNMVALMASLYSRGMSGDLEAIKLFIKYCGYDSTEERLDRESQARVEAMANGGLASIQHSTADDVDTDERTEVVIMLPEDFRNMQENEAEEEAEAERLKGGAEDEKNSPEATERSAN